MPEQTPVLSLPLIQPSQAQKHVTHNEALMRLDALVQAVVLTRDSISPPSDPDAGECHIIPSAATGVWSGQDHALAYFDGAAWQFLAARPGWRVYVLSDLQTVLWDGSAWTGETASLQNLNGVGIGTNSDSTNRLAVSSEASLLSHDGAGHQLKINKSGAADTASLLFQTGWSGRAEMGTAGDDAFAIKVSADGAAWHTALSFDPGTGLVTGDAVQTGATDISAGRLMRADFGYGPGNVLGVVSESAGVPTGAVIERASTVNGDYIRFADGTQICQFNASLSYISAGLCSAAWTFPAGFANGSAPQVQGTLNSESLAVSAPSVTVAGLTGMTISGLGATSVTLNVNALAGASFGSGESVDLGVLAIGRWY